MYEPWQELKQDIKIEPVKEKKPVTDSKKYISIACLIIISCAMLGLGIGVGYSNNNGSQSNIQQQTTLRTVSLQPLNEPFYTGDISFVDVIIEAKDAVVSISTISNTGGMFGPREATGAGSGFIFGIDDEFVYIATNQHVVSNTTAITVSLDDENHIDAVIVGYDADMDTAVLAISRSDIMDISFS